MIGADMRALAPVLLAIAAEALRRRCEVMFIPAPTRTAVRIGQAMAEGRAGEVRITGAEIREVGNRPWPAFEIRVRGRIGSERLSGDIFQAWIFGADEAEAVGQFVAVAARVVRLMLELADLERKDV